MARPDLKWCQRELLNVTLSCSDKRNSLWNIWSFSGHRFSVIFVIDLESRFCSGMYEFLCDTFQLESFQTRKNMVTIRFFQFFLILLKNCGNVHNCKVWNYFWQLLGKYFLLKYCQRIININKILTDLRIFLIFFSILSFLFFIEETTRKISLPLLYINCKCNIVLRSI